MISDLKILIIDDEEPALNVLEKQLYTLGYKSLLQAVNGKEALQLIQQERPDVIISDIQMSEMGGLELLKYIRNITLDIPFILLSGYERFDYAKEALKYQASHYLVKPVSDDELSSVLKDIESELERKKVSKALVQKYNEQINFSKKSLKKSFLEQMIFQPSTIKDYGSLEEQLNLKFIHNNYALLLFSIVTGIDKTPLNDYNLLFFSIENVAQEMLGKKNIICHGFSSQKDFCLICNFSKIKNNAAIFEDEMLNTFKELESFCKLKLYSSLCVGIGFAEKRELLKDAFQTAKKSVEWQIQSMQELYWKNQHSSESNIFFEKKQEFALLQALEECSYESVLKCLEDIFSPFFYSLKGQKQSMDNVSLHIIMLLFKFLKEHSIDVTILGDEFELYQDVASLTSEKKALDWMKDKCILCIRALSQSSGANLDEQAFQVQVQQYILDNLNTSISLESIANHFHFSPNHFSRLFKKVFGISFLKYLTSYRIDEAKRLLATSDMKVLEIGKAVGFHDTKHFYKVFKSYTGYQPSAYRKNLKNPNN